MASADALAWARRAFPGLDPVGACALPAAGSARSLTRLPHTGGSLVLVENPVPVTEAVNENDTFGYLAAHLSRLVAAGAACGPCRFRAFCAGYLKWPDTAYDCGPAIGLLEALETAAARLARDLDEAGSVGP